MYFSLSLWRAVVLGDRYERVRALLMLGLLFSLAGYAVALVNPSLAAQSEVLGALIVGGLTSLIKFS